MQANTYFCIKSEYGKQIMCSERPSFEGLDIFLFTHATWCGYWRKAKYGTKGYNKALAKKNEYVAGGLMPLDARCDPRLTKWIHGDNY